jgi:hypothetical protein
MTGWIAGSGLRISPGVLQRGMNAEHYCARGCSRSFVGKRSGVQRFDQSGRNSRVTPSLGSIVRLAAAPSYCDPKAREVLPMLSIQLRHAILGFVFVSSVACAGKQTSPPSLRIHDPESFIVDRIDLEPMRLPDGVHKVHQFRDSQIWAATIGGHAYCAWPTDEAGRLRESVIFTRVPGALEAVSLKPSPEPAPSPSGPPPMPPSCGPIASVGGSCGSTATDGGTDGGGSDGGTDGGTPKKCKIVCTPPGDGAGCVEVCD